MYFKKAFKKIIPFLLVFSLLIGNAYCYITKTDTQTDTLGVSGSVSIERPLVNTPSYSVHLFTFSNADIQNANFNTSVTKQCRVKNTSSEPARIFLLIKMPNFNAPYIENNVVVDNGYVPFANLFHSGKNTNWVLLKTDSTDIDYTTYLFGYALGGSASRETVAANGTAQTYGARLFDIRNFVQTPAVNFSHEYAADMLKRTTMSAYLIPASAVSTNAQAVSVLPGIFAGDTDLANVCTRGV